MGDLFRSRKVEQDLEDWVDFVQKCEQGYPDDLAQYDYEIDVRTRLEALLFNETLAGIPGRAEFVERLNDIDRRFVNATMEDRPVARPADLPWWDLRLPAFGSETFVADVLIRHGILLQVLE